MTSANYWNVFAYGQDFTVELWVKVVLSFKDEDPAIISYKNWKEVWNQYGPLCVKYFKGGSFHVHMLGYTGYLFVCGSVWLGFTL